MSGGGETQVEDSKPASEKVEEKDPVQVAEATQSKDAELEAKPLGSDGDLAEPAAADRNPGCAGVSACVNDVAGKMSKGKDDVAVETQSLAENVVKMEDVSGGNGVSGSPKCKTSNENDNDNDAKAEDENENDNMEDLKDLSPERETGKQMSIPELSYKSPNPCFDNSGSGTEEEQAAFVKEVETFYKERNLEFKHPKFYKEDLNLLKLWRAVIKLGGYEQVTSCKLWRQVGESFNPPKTCTTVSWTFRIFYEKALLEYEKHKMHGGELPPPDASFTESNGLKTQAGSNQVIGSGRARRDAAARAMQGWHSQRILDNGEVCHPIIKDKSSSPALKGDRHLKTLGLLKRKKPSTELGVQVVPLKSMKSQVDTMVIDIGPPAEWVKINVQKTSDCFEVYALIPGLLREEVHVQSDPAGRLVISGQPKQVDNPWGVTAFKKVVSLPFRIDPHQTSAVVTLHGQLFVRVPFEQSEL